MTTRSPPFTLIDSNYHRYAPTCEARTQISALYKQPSKSMENCDRCAHRHEKSNKWCSQNQVGAPLLRHPPRGGVYLFDLATGAQRDGIWYVQHSPKQGKRVAEAVLTSV